MSGRKWLESELDVVRARYPHETTEAIAVDLGRTTGSVHQKAAQMGLQKSAEWRRDMIKPIRESGREHRFKRGQAPWNKGLNYCPDGASRTWFKPGQLSGAAEAKLLPIGTERVNKDDVVIVKVATGLRRNKCWRPVHTLIWEEANGPVPEGHTVIFVDGNRRNFDLANLLCVSRAELMRRNSRHTNYPPEINQVIQLRGVLTRKINQRERA